MKKGIHPKYVEATISCACGAVIRTRSTMKEIRVGVCSKCHPFFTGTQKYLDTAGRVEKFMKKYAKAREQKKRVRKAKAAAEAPPEAVDVSPGGEETEQKAPTAPAVPGQASTADAPPAGEAAAGEEERPSHEPDPLISESPTREEFKGAEDRKTEDS